MNILTYFLTMPTFNYIPQTFHAQISGQNVHVHNLLCRGGCGLKGCIAMTTEIDHQANSNVAETCTYSKNYSSAIIWLQYHPFPPLQFIEISTPNLMSSEIVGVLQLEILPQQFTTLKNINTGEGRWFGLGGRQ